MSISTDGQICYGIVFEENYIFPWNAKDKYGRIENWWIYKICGHIDPVNIYDSNGHYKSDIPLRDLELNAEVRNNFKEEHPIPVTLVNYCSDECPMYILAIPGTFKFNARGFPEEFNPKELVVSYLEIDALIDFCKEYCQPQKDSGDKFPKMEPKWYLTSYWG